MSKPKRKFEVVHAEDAELNRKKRFTQHDLVSLSPRNPRQHRFFQLYNDNVPMILLDGYPGVGKTLIAMYAGLHQVLDESTHYEKVVIVRSPIESGQSIGFLPGDIDEKCAAFEAPYKALSNDIIKYNDPYDNLKSLDKLEFMLTTHARGITLENSVIILDEVQNMDYPELRTIISRCGEGSRIIICGDENQNDLSRKRKQSGLAHLKRVMLNMPYETNSTVTFKLDDIERSGLVKEFIIADFETEEEFH